ncbi:hypothetical protein ACTWOF_005316, partial [Klebsiella michiganensis]
MASIKELPHWSDEVYQIARGDKVEGGPMGTANMQAKVLADRTRYLKDSVESIPDYREFTFYKTNEDPDGTITGLAATVENQAFRVGQGPDSDLAFIYYLHINGTAKEIARTPSVTAIDNVLRYIKPLPDGSLVISGENGAVLVIDKTAATHLVELIIQHQIRIGGLRLSQGENDVPLMMTGDNGVPFALDKNGTLRTVGINIFGSGLSGESFGAPLLIGGRNGIAGAVDKSGAFRIPAVITDELTVAGKKITGNGGGSDPVFS